MDDQHESKPPPYSFSQGSSAVAVARGILDKLSNTGNIIQPFVEADLSSKYAKHSLNFSEQLPAMDDETIRRIAQLLQARYHAEPGSGSATENGNGQPRLAPSSPEYVGATTPTNGSSARMRSQKYETMQDLGGSHRLSEVDSLHEPPSTTLHQRPILTSITSDEGAIPAQPQVQFNDQNLRLAIGDGHTLNSLRSTRDLNTQSISQENEPGCLPGHGDVPLAIEGGIPIRKTPWPTYDKGAVCIHPEDEDAAIRAIRSHLYFRYDYRLPEETECGQLEHELSDFFGVKHVLAVASGTTALALAIMGARIPAGSLIAVSGFTFAATPSAIILAGCKPFLVEVDQNLHLDVGDLRRRWRPEIKAIVVVHMRGFASDVVNLKLFAREMGVPLLEDAVPALGVEVHGQKLGTFGLAGAFSTQSDKALNSGEGGFLVTNDTELYARAVILSGAYQGRIKRHFSDGSPPFKMDLKLPLFSFRMDEIRAALLRSELRRLPQRLASFSSHYKRVSKALADVPEISIRKAVGPDAYLGESFIFRVHGGGASWFTRALRMEGIDASNLGMIGDSNVRVFWNWRFLFDTDNIATIQAQLGNTTRYLQEAIDIPLSSTLSVEDCDQLVQAIRRIAKALNQRRQPEL